MIIFICFIGCEAAGPKPPIELPFAVHKAGATVTTEVRIVEARTYPFCLKFMYEEKNFVDEERVHKLVGGHQKNKHGKLVEPGIPIPLKITVSAIESSGEKILSEEEFLAMGQLGHGINYYDRRIGRVYLPKGLCRVKVLCQKDIRELANTKVFLGIYLRESGKI